MREVDGHMKEINIQDSENNEQTKTIFASTAMKTNTTGRLQEAKRISKVSEGSQSTMNRKLGLP